MANNNNNGFQWNKVTPLSKSIALVLFIVLPFVGFWLGIQQGQLLEIAQAPTISLPMVTSTTQTSSGAAYYANVAEWQTDTRSDAKFSIAYPIDFDVTDSLGKSPVTDWRMGANAESGILFYTLTIPRAFAPQTNLVNAQLTVGASDNNTAIADCLNAEPSGGPAMATSTITIGGVAFTVFNSSDAGAGNLYQTTSYRTVHGGQCWAVEYTIHSSQIGNYPASYNLQPFDQGQLTDVLNRIAGTFTFL